MLIFFPTKLSLSQPYEKGSLELNKTLLLFIIQVDENPSHHIIFRNRHVKENR